MQLKNMFPGYPFVFLVCLMLLLFVGCIPTGTPRTARTVSICNEGGRGIFTPEDVQCYLANPGSGQVRNIDEEKVVLFAEAQSIPDWVGGAIIYHIPTRSMLVLDRFGDVDPQASFFSSRAGLAALSEFAGDPELMAGLKLQVQQELETTTSDEPEIRLSIAWQDGQVTVFLIAVAGLESEDDRFYCPNQTWTIGDHIEEIAFDCMMHEAGAPISHVFFEAKRIKGSGEQTVMVALNGMESNAVQVHEGVVAQETAIYQAVLQQVTYRPVIIRGETMPGFEEDPDQMTITIDPKLLQNYQMTNKTPISLRFLFYDSNIYFVNSSAVIAREFLTARDSQKMCEQFRSEYPGLGGIVTLSRIGYSDDGEQALVRIVHECGSDNRSAAYFILVRNDKGWRVVEEKPLL
ncbi:MAG: hypothetical protein WBL25_21290 [Anaerolineales bacterium]